MFFRVILVFLLMPAAYAELPPSAYEAMQAKAPEHVQIEILRVEVEPGEAPTQKTSSSYCADDGGRSHGKRPEAE